MWLRLHQKNKFMTDTDILVNTDNILYVEREDRKSPVPTEAQKGDVAWPNVIKWETETVTKIMFVYEETIFVEESLDEIDELMSVTNALKGLKLFKEMVDEGTLTYDNPKP